MKRFSRFVKAANLIGKDNIAFNKSNFVKQQLNDYLSFWVDGYIAN